MCRRLGARAGYRQMFPSRAAFLAQSHGRYASRPTTRCSVGTRRPPSGVTSDGCGTMPSGEYRSDGRRDERVGT